MMGGGKKTVGKFGLGLFLVGNWSLALSLMVLLIKAGLDVFSENPLFAGILWFMSICAVAVMVFVTIRLIRFKKRSENKEN